MGALLGAKDWDDIVRELKELNNPAINVVINGYYFNKNNREIRSEYVIILARIWEVVIRDKS